MLAGHCGVKVQLSRQERGGLILALTLQMAVDEKRQPPCAYDLIRLSVRRGTRSIIGLSSVMSSLRLAHGLGRSPAFRQPPSVFIVQ